MGFYRNHWTIGYGTRLRGSVQLRKRVGDRRLARQLTSCFKRSRGGPEVCLARSAPGTAFAAATVGTTASWLAGDTVSNISQTSFRTLRQSPRRIIAAMPAGLWVLQSSRYLRAKWRPNRTTFRFRSISAERHATRMIRAVLFPRLSLGSRYACSTGKVGWPSSIYSSMSSSVTPTPERRPRIAAEGNCGLSTPLRKVGWTVSAV